MNAARWATSVRNVPRGTVDGLPCLGLMIVCSALRTRTGEEFRVPQDQELGLPHDPSERNLITNHHAILQVHLIIHDVVVGNDSLILANPVILQDFPRSENRSPIFTSLTIQFVIRRRRRRLDVESALKIQLISTPVLVIPAVYLAAITFLRRSSTFVRRSGTTSSPSTRLRPPCS